MDDCLLILGRSRVRTVSFWFCFGLSVSKQNVEKLVKVINKNCRDTDSSV